MRRLLLHIGFWLLCGGVGYGQTNITTQTTNIDAITVQNNSGNSYAGTYNNSTELANYANQNNGSNTTPGTAAFRTFTVNQTATGGTQRTLRPGDRFVITAFSTQPTTSGVVGISFKNNTTYTNVSDYTNGQICRFELTDAGGWKIVHGGGTTENAGATAGSDRSLQIDITSSSTFDATIAGTAYRNLSFINAGPIASFCIYNIVTAAGTNRSNPNTFWKNASLQGRSIELFSPSDATISGTISDGGGENTNTLSATALSYTGTNNLTLSGSNTYSGTSTLSAGTVLIGHNNAFGTGGLVLTGGTLSANGGSRALANNITLLVNGGTITGSNDLTLNGSFTNQGGNRSLTVNSTGTTTLAGNVFLSENSSARLLTIGGTGNTVISGVIANYNGAGGTGGSLTKTGTGTLTLSNANTFSGTATFSTGNIVVGNKAAFGTATLSLNGVGLTGNTDLSGVNALTNTTNLVGNNTFSGTNSFEFAGAVTQNTNSRTITNNIAGGTLSFSGQVFLSNNANNYTLTINGTGNTNVGAVIANGGTATAGGLTFSGSGTLQLSGANTYLGSTTISGGTITLAAAHTLPVNSSAGTIIFSGSGTRVFNTGNFDIGTSTAAANSAGQLDFDVNTTINLGSSNTLYFKASAGQNWSASTITINGWTGTKGGPSTGPRIFVGSDATGLTIDQLNKITFTGFDAGAQLLSTGELVPTNMPTIVSFAGSPGTASSGYAGSTITISGSNFSNVTDVQANNVSVGAFTVVNETTITFTATAATTGNLKVITASGSVTSTATYTHLGFITAANGDWNTPATWLGGSTPTAGSAVTIAHSNTVNATVTDNPATVTVNSGASLDWGAAAILNVGTGFTNNGNVNMHSTGVLSIPAAGWLTNGGTMLAGILSMGTGATLTNNSVFSGGSGTVNFAGAGTIAGTAAASFHNLTINTGALAVPAGAALRPTVNGTLQINGGNLGNPIYYGAGSTLLYNTTYGRFVEWNNNGAGTLGTTLGYPNHVVVNAGTFDIHNASSQARACAGNFTIKSGATVDFNTMPGVLTIAGSLVVENGGTLDMDAMTSAGRIAVTGSLTADGLVNLNNSGGRLEITGNVTQNGTITLSNNTGGDLYVGGNFTKNSGTFNCNNRELRFTGTGTTSNYSSNAVENLHFLNNAKTGSGILNLNSSINFPNSGNSATFGNNSTTNIPSGVTITLNDGTNWTNGTTNCFVNVAGTLRNTGTTGTNSFTSTVNNLIFQSTGLYDHNMTRSGSGSLGTIPTATWQTGSTCLISGLTNPNNGGWPGGATQSFSNFTWNTPAMSTSPNMAGSVLNVSGTFSVVSTGTGEIRFSADAAGTAIAIAHFDQSGGTINMVSGSAANRTMNVTGSFLRTGGTLTVTGSGNGVVNFSGSSGNQNITAGTNISGNIHFRCNNASGIAITGTLPINQGATFFRTQGAVTGTVSYNATSSTLTYEGAVTTGDEFPSANGPVNLSLTGGSTVVTLHASRNISGLVTFNTNGCILNTSSSALLRVTNTATGAIVNASASRYISGPLERAIDPSLSSTAYTFPVGKGGNYYPATLGLVTGTNPVIRFEAFNTNCNGTADGQMLASISNTEYWQAALVSGSLSAATLSLQRPATLSGLNAIGRSNTVDGSYTTQGGSASGTTIQNAFIDGSFGFFVMAVQNTVYYRSNMVTMNWHDAASWQASTSSSFASNVFVPSLAPSATNSAGITIRIGHTVTISSASGQVSLDQTTVQFGATLKWTGGSIVVNNGSGNDLIIQGTFEDNNSTAELPSYISTPLIYVNDLGRILITATDAMADGYASDQYALKDRISWTLGSIFEWNVSTPFSTDGVTYFPNATADVIPVFRVSSVIGLGVGAGGSLTINGLFEANAAITFNNAGTKTFRNGIYGTADITQQANCGAFVINGSNSMLGGTGVLNLNSTVADGLQITFGTCLLFNSKVVNTNASKTIKVTTSDATFNAQGNSLSGSIGFEHTSNASTFITSHANGVNGTLGGITGPVSFASNVNYTFNGSGNQVTGSLMGASAFNLEVNKTNSTDRVILTNNNTQVRNLLLTKGLFGAGTGNTLQFGDGAFSDNINTIRGTGPDGYSGNFVSDDEAGILRLTNYTDVYGNSSLELRKVECYNNKTPSGVRFLTSSNDLLQTASVPVIKDYIKLISQGFISRAPLYGSGSLLIYSNTGSYDRTTEWGNVPNAPGYPWHVTVEAGTTLNLGTQPVSPDSLYMGGDLRVGTDFGTGTVNMTGMSKPFSIGGNLIVGSTNSGGTGVFNMNNVARPVLVKGNLEIGADGATGSDFNMSTTYGGDLWIGGNFTRYNGSTWDDPNERAVYLFGGSNGIISTPGVTASPANNPTQYFNYLFIEKASATQNVTLGCPVGINRLLQLNTGDLVTSAASILSIRTGGTVSGGSISSFVNGPMEKRTNNSGGNASDDFTFPLGKTGLLREYRPARIADMAHDGTNITTYTAEYFQTGGTGTGGWQTTDLFTDSRLVGVYKNQYWMIDQSPVKTGVGGRVGLYYQRGLDDFFPVAYRSNSAVAPVKFYGSAPGNGSWEYTVTGKLDMDAGPYFEAIGGNTAAMSWVYTGFLDEFSPFSIGFGDNRVLPLNLLTFSATLHGPDALLHWTLADANPNLERFEVEHSTDGTLFNRLATLAHNGLTRYNYRHAGLLPGVHYYRLKGVDKDGTVSYSKVELLMVNTSQTIITGLMNNPVQGGQAVLRMYSAGNQQAEAVIFDMAGRALLRQKLALRTGYNQPSLSMLLLPKGMYKLLIKTGDGVEKVITVMK